MDSNELSGLQGLSQISTAVEYCPACHFPLQGCRCAEIAEEREKMAQRAKLREIQALGGERAVVEYTLDKFADKAAIAECAEFPKRGLFIYGPVGCGKTHLATAIIRSHKGARVIRATDYLRQLRACKTAQDEVALLNALAAGPLLLDDIGAEKVTEFALTALWELLDRRWQNMASGLIITSNLGLDALAAKFGEDRTISRIAGMCKSVEINGPDYRLRR